MTIWGVFFLQEYGKKAVYLKIQVTTFPISPLDLFVIKVHHTFNNCNVHLIQTFDCFFYHRYNEFRFARRVRAHRVAGQLQASVAVQRDIRGHGHAVFGQQVHGERAPRTVQQV